MYLLEKIDMSRNILEKYCKEKGIEYERLDLCKIAMQEGLSDDIIRAITCLVYKEVDLLKRCEKGDGEGYRCAIYLILKYHKILSEDSIIFEKKDLMSLIEMIIHNYVMISPDEIHGLLDIYLSLGGKWARFYPAIERRLLSPKTMDKLLESMIQEFIKGFEIGKYEYSFDLIHYLVIRHLLVKKHIDMILSKVIETDIKKFSDVYEKGKEEAVKLFTEYKMVNNSLIEAFSEYKKQEGIDFSTTFKISTSQRGHKRIEFEIRKISEDMVEWIIKGSRIFGNRVYELRIPKTYVKNYIENMVLDRILTLYECRSRDYVSYGRIPIERCLNIFRYLIYNQILTTEQVTKILNCLVSLHNNLCLEYGLYPEMDQLRRVVHKIRQIYGIPDRQVGLP